MWTHHKNLEHIRKAKRLNSCQPLYALFFTRFNFVLSYSPGYCNAKLCNASFCPMMSPQPVTPASFGLPALWPLWPGTSRKGWSKPSTIKLVQAPVPPCAYSYLTHTWKSYSGPTLLTSYWHHLLLWSSAHPRRPPIMLIVAFLGPGHPRFCEGLHCLQSTQTISSPTIATSPNTSILMVPHHPMLCPWPAPFQGEPGHLHCRRPLLQDDTLQRNPCTPSMWLLFSPL